MLYAVVLPVLMACNTASSWGTVGLGRSSRRHHRSSAHFPGSTIRGSPVHERAVKKKSIRSSIASPVRVRCMAVTNLRSRSLTPISSRASRWAASYAVSRRSTWPAAAAAPGWCM